MDEMNPVIAGILVGMTGAGFSDRDCFGMRLSLEESIVIYERGEALKKHCDDLLKRAEARIEKITFGADGKPKGTAPLDLG